MPVFDSGFFRRAVTELPTLGFLKSDAERRRRCARLFLAYLMLNRSKAAAIFRARDLRLSNSEVQVQVPDYKVSASLSSVSTWHLQSRRRRGGGRRTRHFRSSAAFGLCTSAAADRRTSICSLPQAA